MTKARGKRRKIPSVWELPEEAVEREFRKLAREDQSFTIDDARLNVAEDWIIEHVDPGRAVVELAGLRVPIGLDWGMQVEGSLLVTEVARAAMRGFRELQERRLNGKREVAK